MYQGKVICLILREDILIKNIYAGFDPTADSLHIGHLNVLVNCLRLLRQEGENLFILVKKKR